MQFGVGTVPAAELDTSCGTASGFVSVCVFRSWLGRCAFDGGVLKVGRKIWWSSVVFVLVVVVRRTIGEEK